MILLIKVPLFNQFIVGVDQVDNVVKHTKKKVTQPREEKVLHSRLCQTYIYDSIIQFFYTHYHFENNISALAYTIFIEYMLIDGETNHDEESL